MGRGEEVWLVHSQLTVGETCSSCGRDSFCALAPIRRPAHRDEMCGGPSQSEIHVPDPLSQDSYGHLSLDIFPSYLYLIPLSQDSYGHLSLIPVPDPLVPGQLCWTSFLDTCT